MRLLFLGAGAIGTYVGGSLAAAGHHVTFSEQPEAARIIAEQGLRLTRDNRTTSVRDFAIFDSADAALAAGGRTPQAGCALALEMAERCRRVEGDFVLLWHNTSLIEEWALWSAAYRELILRLADLQAGRA